MDVTYCGKEKGIDANEGENTATSLFVTNKFVDGIQCDATMFIEARPDGLDQLVLAGVFGCHLDDPVGYCHRDKRVDDGGWDILLNVHEE